MQKCYLYKQIRLCYTHYIKLILQILSISYYDFLNILFLKWGDFLGLPKILASGIFDTSVRSDLRFKSGELLTPLRTVREHEIEFFCEDGGISFINGTENPIKKGCILIASPGDKRQSRLHFKAMFMHFSVTDDRLKEMIDTLPRFIRDCEAEKYNRLFSAICDRVPDFDDYSDIADAGRLISLIYSLRKDCNVNNARSDRAESSQSAVLSSTEYIKEHYSEPLSIDFLAERCHLSTSYFYRIFTQVVDTPPNEYIIKTRLTAAQNMLISSDAPIVEIAARCGFNSQSYFSFVFKEHFKMSPKEFRKTHFYEI